MQSDGEFAERALAGHDHAIGASHHLGIAGDDRFAADLRQRARYRAQISRANVDDSNARPSAHADSVPLVDGTAPPSRGSIWVAASQARAKALKMHSMT